jgi:hypothetical protein
MYAEAVPPGVWPGGGLTFGEIGVLRRFDAAAFVPGGRGAATAMLPNR